MSEEAEDLETGTVLTAKAKNGSDVSVRAWFMRKLGTTTGERIFKEFVEFTEESTQSLPGVPGVILDNRSGRVVSVQLSN